MQEKVLYAMSDIIESRDIETGGHVRRTSEVVCLLMRAMRNDPESGVTDAFCSHVIKCAPMHDLGIPHDRLNVNGGALALGHPIGASGARLIVTLIHALKARGLKRGVASLCIGGGEATAIAVEMA